MKWALSATVDLVLLLAGCGDDGDDGEPSPPNVPSLIGERLRLDWLASYIRAPHDLRPMLEEAMVRTRLEDKDLQTMIRYFAAVANAPLLPPRRGDGDRLRGPVEGGDRGEARPLPQEGLCRLPHLRQRGDGSQRGSTRCRRRRREDGPQFALRA